MLTRDGCGGEHVASPLSWRDERLDRGRLERTSEPHADSAKKKDLISMSAARDSETEVALHFSRLPPANGSTESTAGGGPPDTSWPSTVPNSCVFQAAPAGERTGSAKPARVCIGEYSRCSICPRLWRLAMSSPSTSSVIPAASGLRYSAAAWATMTSRPRCAERRGSGSMCVQDPTTRRRLCSMIKLEIRAQAPITMSAGTDPLRLGEWHGKLERSIV